MRTTGFLLLAALLASRAPCRAEPLAPSARIVANPAFDAWGAFKPGAWVRYRVEVGDDPHAPRWKSEVRVLADSAPHAHIVLVYRGDAPIGASAGPTTVQREVVSTWLLPERTGILFLPGEQESTSEVEATLDVSGKKLACKLLTLRFRSQPRSPAVLRSWWSPAIPGGLARFEREDLSDEGKPALWERYTAAAWASTVQGSGLTTLPAKDKDLEWVRDPEYDGWAGFQPGAWVRTKHSSPGAEGDASAQTERLLERTDNAVLLETDFHEPPPGGSPAGLPVNIVYRFMWRGTYRELYKDAADAKVKKTVAQATRRVAGKDFACTLEDVAAPESEGRGRLERRTWSSPQVPGGLLRREERLYYDGKLDVEQAWEIDAYGTTPPAK